MTYVLDRATAEEIESEPSNDIRWRWTLFDEDTWQTIEIGDTLGRGEDAINLIKSLESTARNLRKQLGL